MTKRKPRQTDLVIEVCPDPMSAIHAAPRKEHDYRFSEDLPHWMMFPSEPNAIKAANAALSAYDSAMKLLAFLGNEDLSTMYYPVLIDSLKECAEALGYRMTPTN